MGKLKTDSLQKQRISRGTLSNIIFNPAKTWIIASLLLLFEVFLNIFIIESVKYTEIDWVAYMQEVEGFMNGTYNYYELKGDTGPLVYPAGFVYLFSGLHCLTESGRNIKRAQYIFAAFYILSLSLVFRIYSKSKMVPPYVLALMCFTSYRIHSIYVLRLFNDPIAMIFLYAAINCFIDGWWKFGSLLFSVAVSIKMNVLLFAPALLYIYLTQLGFKGTICQLSICASVQVLLGSPFLLTDAWAYISCAFNIGRVFLYEWTVNWKFLPEEIFLKKEFHISLLAIHLLLLGSFAYFIWHVGLRRSVSNSTSNTCHRLFLIPLFSSNLLGMAVSRSLHYQFYVWYYHSLPYLLWTTSLPTPLKLVVFSVFEVCWNVFPATWWSSALLQLAHITLLASIAFQHSSYRSLRKGKHE